jgi:hypothetical protein
MAMDSPWDTAKSGGLPHSEISGSTVARTSPELFAACHVLHRLSVPRHSPDALLSNSPTPSPKRAGPEIGDQRAEVGPDTADRPRSRSFEPLGLRPEPGHKPSRRRDHAPRRVRIPMPRSSQDGTAGPSFTVTTRFTMSKIGGRRSEISAADPPRSPSRTRRSPTPEDMPETVWSPISVLCHLNLVGLGRLERPTSRLSGVRSNQLSYRPRPEGSMQMAARSRLRLRSALCSLLSEPEGMRGRRPGLIADGRSEKPRKPAMPAFCPLLSAICP